MLFSQHLDIYSVWSNVFVIIFILSVGLNIKLYLKERAEETSSASTPLHTYPPSFIEELLNKTRSEIKYQLSSHNFSFSGSHGLEDLVTKVGRNPLRSIIISTWKSGSTFLGKLLNSVPGTYYHFEPLFPYGFRRIRSILEAKRSVATVKNLLNCNYEGLLQDYFRLGRKNLGFFEQNKRLWEHCEINKNMCDDASFVSRVCELFPIQAMKIVRLRLQLIRKILDDKKLKVKVIFLIRDPRGVVQYRQHRNFCQKSPECLTAPVVCADMVSDFVAAGLILQKYPGRLMVGLIVKDVHNDEFNDLLSYSAISIRPCILYTYRVVRYEELAKNPDVIFHQVLKFLKITNKRANYSAFDHRDTNMEVRDPDLKSAFRVFRDEAFKWQKTLNFSAINDIQMACKKAMLLWGYKMAYNESHLKSKDFNPTADVTTLKEKFNLSGTGF